jgi:hypothetical protein
MGSAKIGMKRIKLNTAFDGRRAEPRRSTQVAFDFKLHKPAEPRRSPIK